jgi:hypothetical protein
VKYLYVDNFAKNNLLNGSGAGKKYLYVDNFAKNNLLNGSGVGMLNGVAS